MNKNFIKKILQYETNDIIRDSWVINKLKELPNGAQILDAGAGEQKYREHCSHLIYTSQDFCEYDGTGNGQALQVGSWDTSKIDIISDITSIPVDDESFDAILCTEVFEHLPDPVKALHEFTRILKRDGVLLITAPYACLIHFAPYLYSSGFSKYWYEYHLEDSFAIDEINCNGNYYDYMAQEIIRLTAVHKLGYLKKDINIINKIMLLSTYRLLKKMSKNDVNSRNLLTMGFHVKATRK